MDTLLNHGFFRSSLIIKSSLPIPRMMTDELPSPWIVWPCVPAYCATVSAKQYKVIKLESASPAHVHRSIAVSSYTCCGRRPSLYLIGKVKYSLSVDVTSDNSPSCLTCLYLVPCTVLVLYLGNNRTIKSQLLSFQISCCISLSSTKTMNFFYFINLLTK